MCESLEPLSWWLKFCVLPWDPQVLIPQPDRLPPESQPLPYVSYGRCDIASHSESSSLYEKLPIPVIGFKHPCQFSELPNITFQALLSRKSPELEDHRGCVTCSSVQSPRCLCVSCSVLRLRTALYRVMAWLS